MLWQKLARFSLFIWIFFSTGAKAQLLVNDDAPFPESYPRDYVFTLFTANRALADSHRELVDHLHSAGIAYHHRLAHPWMVSVGYRPQSYLKRIDHQPISLMTFSNVTQRIIRLYHPWYFLAGTEILYLIPVQKINPPLAKDPDYATEIGIGARASLWYLLGQKCVLAMDIERLRGTKTNRLHVLSMSFSLGWGF